VGGEWLRACGDEAGTVSMTVSPKMEVIMIWAGSISGWLFTAWMMK
jgi:hypothetical protein